MNMNETSNNTIVLDSGIWIEILRGTEKGKQAVEFLKDRDFITTTISVAEVERAMIREGEEDKIPEFRKYVDSGGCITLTREIAQTSARLSLKHKLHMADALIYACARINDYIFKGINKDNILSNGKFNLELTRTNKRFELPCKPSKALIKIAKFISTRDFERKR